MDSIRSIINRIRDHRIDEAKSKYYGEKSDVELVDLVKHERDQLAFEVLVARYKDLLGKMTNKYFMDSQDKDDVYQLVQIAFWEAVQKWDGSGELEAFAGMIIKRRMTDELRKDSAGKRLIHSQAASLDATSKYANDEEGDTLADLIPDETIGVNPEDYYLGKEGAKEFQKFIEKELSQKERDAVMKKIKGLKIPQIAEEMGLSYKSVENTLMRVKYKVKSYMEKKKEKESYRESKKISESKESALEFSDEEKQVLESVITKANKKVLREQMMNRFHRN